MCPKARHVFNWGVSEWGQIFGESFVCNFPGVGETVHPFSNLTVYPSVDRNVTEVILCDYLAWNDVDVEFHILKFV